MDFVGRGDPEPVDNGLSDEEDDEDYIVPATDEAIGRGCGSDLHKNNLTEGDDLYEAMKFSLFVGAIVGLAPLATKPEGHGRSSPLFQARILISILSIILMGSNTVIVGIDFAMHMSSTNPRNMGDIAGKLATVWFYASGLFVQSFCLLRSAKVSQYFRFWSKVSRETKWTMVEEPRLTRDLTLISVIIFISCVGENTLYHVFAMRSGILVKITDRQITFSDFLEDYFNSNQYLQTFFNYNPVLSFFVLLTNKLTLFAFNFGDVLLIMISWVVHVRFRGFNRFLEQHLTSDTTSSTSSHGSISWSLVRRNYFLLIKLLDEADSIFYPLIWVSYGTNIFFVCNQLYMGIRHTDIKTTAHKMYVIWSFLHLGMRTMAVNTVAARVNDDSGELAYILQLCPPSEYNHDVRRLERFLSSRIIGISANGIFVVTRSFILMIISAIFTLEVVLLQNSAVS